MDYAKSSFEEVVKKWLATCCLLLCALLGFAQQPSLPALKKQLQKSNADSVRVNLLIKTGNYFLSKKLADSAQYYASQAENLSASLKYVEGTGNSYILMAQASIIRKDKDACYPMIQKAIDLFTKYKLYRPTAEAVIRLGDAHAVFEGDDVNRKIASLQKASIELHKSTDKKREADVLKDLGDNLQILGRHEESLTILKQSFAVYQSIHYPYLQGIYDLMGSVSAQLGDYNKAIKYGLLAVKTAEAVNDTTMQLCTIYNRLGLTYYITRQFKIAQNYFEKSLVIAEKYKDSGSIILLASNLSVIYLKYNKPEKVIPLLKRTEANQPNMSIEQRATIESLILIAYATMKQYDEGLAYCKKQLEIAKQLDQHSNPQEIVQHAIANFYIAFKMDKPAREHLAHFRSLSIEHQNPANIAKSYLLAFKLDSAETKYAEAVEAYKKYTAINDSLFSKKKANEIERLQIQYETEKKDHELKIKEQNIQLLTKQAQLQKANIKQERLTRNLTIAGAALLALLLGLNYNRFRLKRRINQKLQVQQNEISQKNRSLTTLVQEKDNLLEEKEWLMKEIHHRVKNNLQIVISLLNTQSNYITNDIAFNAIRESQHRMQSISLIHQKLYQSENLALVDMPAYINDLVDYLKTSFDTGTRISFETHIVDAEFDVTRAVPLGLILNEAITNAIKYAFKDGREGKISISMEETDHNTYILKISDNGSGIPSPENITKSKTLGMSLIRGLSKQVGGTFKVENDNGLSVIIEFTNDKFIKAVKNI
ncbi:tetratricopeptide repeat-containing sensor histidine kinase [Mucilaginibacter kameinonensis]|uniref:tetratricopeptide repeat-containing sensor histidine kinase n=1 Tax=Mucilaginibacter kameinonensis TaxID=452286 RepID=UPI000EF795C1|nr:histidine kinase dimerization/phosphoacceptor domain -containing protein [Mucilaginibacter kameinonensis]